MINNEYLYHFTSSENLIRILETMSLKLSDFKKLNDLNENNIPHYYFINGRGLAQTKNYIKNHCKILCFSQTTCINIDFSAEPTILACGLNMLKIAPELVLL